MPSSVDLVVRWIFTHAMCWIPLILAGTSLLALPHPIAAACAIASRSSAAEPLSTQTGVSEGNMPTSRYLELRSQTLTHARPISGPRLKNPNLTTGGIDRDTATSLAEQRADRLNRVGFSSQSAHTTALLSNQPATLLPSSPSTVGAQRSRTRSSSELIPHKSSCSIPTIHAVNGRATAPVFTPAEPDSHYRITGCGFGSAPGTIRLQPSITTPSSGSALQPITMQIESWRDDYIDARINPGLTGIPDFAADLVIQLPSGRNVQLTRCQFLASRGEPQLLRSIPAAWVRLDATSLSARAIHQVEFESPPVAGAETPPDAVGSSAFIVRSNPQAFSTGRDSYDLSQLAPGWVVESVRLRVFNAACPGASRLPVSNGSWETSWTAHGFVVAWADETCSSPIPPVFNFTLSSSQYATDIWVIGPAGTQPLLNGIGARQP